jgi:hypothetical protein
VDRLRLSLLRRFAVLLMNGCTWFDGGYCGKVQL